MNFEYVDSCVRDNGEKKRPTIEITFRRNDTLILYNAPIENIEDMFFELAACIASARAANMAWDLERQLAFGRYTEANDD